MKNKRIKQAVILCGGRGLRLKPLTDKIPKPMVDVNGKPFLFYLVEYLKSMKINKIIFLTGYKSKIIENYFGNGSDFKINIIYSYASTLTNTGKRIHNAKNYLDNKFLLMYSDNFINFNLKLLEDFHNLSNNIITLLITKKKPGNIFFDQSKNIYEYSIKRDSKNEYVELGFMILEKKYIFQYLSNKNTSFNKTLLKISNDKLLGAKEVYNSYYSIGDIDRLKKTRSYFKSKKIILIDRDGVINKKRPKGKYVTKSSELEFIDDTINAMKFLSNRNFKFIIITNQAGIARGTIKNYQLDQINNKIFKYFKSININLLDIYICPHHWDTNCFCRKPNPGLFFLSSKKYKFRLDKCIYIGDQISDLLAAKNSFCHCALIINRKKFNEIPKNQKPLLFSSKLSNLCDKIIDLYDNYEK